MKPYYQEEWITIYCGDCRGILPALSNASAIVTDPPYELGFMGKSWDSKGVSFQKETWEIIRNACLSGSPLLSFGGTRTFHRIAVAIEDAGWEIRDTLMWVYGSGFPKSLDISKAIEKSKGIKPIGKKPAYGAIASRELIEERGWHNINNALVMPSVQTEEAQLWEGYGTALKPAYEPIILAMNPLDGTFANNALKHGVAGLNIDECRIGTEQRYNAFAGNKDTGFTSADNRTDAGKGLYAGKKEGGHTIKGRFPANFIHDGSQMVMELFPNGETHAMSRKRNKFGGIFGNNKEVYNPNLVSSNGSAARFFYCAKASKSERNKGCEGLKAYKKPSYQEIHEHGNVKCNKCGHYFYSGTPCQCEEPDWDRPVGKSSGNNHPTVKPLALMEYLVRLITMPDYNLVVDPFCGSGTTLLACIRLGIPCIGIDNDEKTCEIAARRCSQEVMELV